jgi:transcription antitermination protein NusB
MSITTQRRKAREVAMQLLVQVDFNKKTIRKEVDRFAQARLVGLRDSHAVPFAMALYDGVLGKLEAIDDLLKTSADNWKLHRMTAVDRNVLRLCTYEMLHMPDATPAAVALDEAIELAKRFGTKDSPAFVNGVLDKIHKNHQAENQAMNEAKKEEEERPKAENLMEPVAPVSPPHASDDTVMETPALTELETRAYLPKSDN